MKRLVCLALFLVGCDQPTPTPTPTSTATSTSTSTSTTTSTPTLPATPWKAAAIAHGGVGNPPANSDGCKKAVDAALAALESGADPVDAAVAGVVVMEDDPRFNAGTGSFVRIDGKTVQMDASVMRSDGRFGAVAGIERVKNPVKVARAVLDTPHLLIAGDGATRFARSLGMPDYDPSTPGMRERSANARRLLATDDPSLPEAWRSFDWRARWNFEAPPPDAAAPASPLKDAGSDTVGVAVRAKDGRFGVALSTGGTAITLRGRVGDVPILGAGLYAGAWGAAASTGAGERIVEAGLARQVVGWLASGAHAQDAADRAVDTLHKKDIGIIVLSPTEMAAAASNPMAWAARESGSSEWAGPR